MYAPTRSLVITNGVIVIILTVVSPRSSPTHQALHKAKHTGARVLGAAFDPVAWRNLSTTIRAPSSTERQQSLRQAPGNTNRITPTPPKPNCPPTSRIKNEDGDHIMSDSYGQDILSNRSGMTGIGILDDIANFELDEDEADSCYSFTGDGLGEPAEKSKMRKMSQ